MYIEGSQGTIRVLDSELAGKIAAGEVVERPSSVVKELVENSIDAGAKRISIYIQDAGKRNIKVVDDGEGMVRADAISAFKRHATSKITSEEDLSFIDTMGFRGEAIPSIASVSRVCLITRKIGDMAGTMVRVNAGTIEDISEYGCAEGTSVQVEDLFFNTPARRKFLKTNLTEFGHIKDAVERTALAHPAIAFKLLNGRNEVINTPPADLKRRVMDILCGTDDREFIAIESIKNNIQIGGYISTPENTNATTKGFYTYINNRWVRDKGLNRSIINGCRHLFINNRFPAVVLTIHLPFNDVDVNVHPAKTEVRFRYPMEVYRMVEFAVKNAFIKASYTRAPLFEPDVKGSLKMEYPAWGGDNRIPLNMIKEDSHGEELTFQKWDAGIRGPAFPGLKIIGQLWQEYILCAGNDEFYIIDQHAAAERIKYERLRKDYYTGANIKKQLLLTPQIFELTDREAGLIEGYYSLINKIGFDIEGFGRKTYIIKAVPEILSGKDCIPLFKELFEEISQRGTSSRLEDAIDRVLLKIACHGVIRGSRRLSEEEIISLLKQLSKTDLSGYCPHGRPVVKVFKKWELEGIFKRR